MSVGDPAARARTRVSAHLGLCLGLRCAHTRAAGRVEVAAGRVEVAAVPVSPS